MRILIDTQILLWWVLGVDRFSADAKKVILNPGARLILSLASVWETALKLDKLGLTDRFERMLNTAIDDLGLSILSIELKHVTRSGYLPYHHRDPFDRLLVAQAIIEGIPILTADAAIAKYPVQVIW